MRQLLYVSDATALQRQPELDRILEQSRHNNAIDGLTGVLWADGWRFLQVLEGPDESVEEAFARIQEDGRHHNIVVVHDLPIVAREFGTWLMAHRTAMGTADGYDERMRRLLADASKPVRDGFAQLVAYA